MNAPIMKLDDDQRYKQAMFKEMVLMCDRRLTGKRPSRVHVIGEVGPEEVDLDIDEEWRTIAKLLKMILERELDLDGLA